MNRVIITGGSGDIAQGIKSRLELAGIECTTPSRDELGVAFVDDVYNYFVENKGKFDVLINCAGIIDVSSISQSFDLDWTDVINVNLNGSYFCSKYALKSGVKTIINIGSSAGFKGKADWSSYCVSKAGLAMLTECLAAEGVEAYTISPGRTQSKMRRELFPDEDQDSLLTPEEIGNLVIDIIYDKYPIGSNVSISKAEGIKLK